MRILLSVLMGLALASCRGVPDVTEDFDRPSSQRFDLCAMSSMSGLSAEGTAYESITVHVSVPGPALVERVADRLSVEPQPTVVRSTSSFLWDPAPRSLGAGSGILLAEPLQNYSHAGGRFTGYSVVFSLAGVEDGAARAADRLWLLLADVLERDSEEFGCPMGSPLVEPSEPPNLPPQPRRVE